MIKKNLLTIEILLVSDISLVSQSLERAPVHDPPRSASVLCNDVPTRAASQRDILQPHSLSNLTITSR